MSKQEKRINRILMMVGIIAVNIVLLLLTHPSNALRIFLVWIITAAVFRIVYNIFNYIHQRNKSKLSSTKNKFKLSSTKNK